MRRSAVLIVAAVAIVVGGTSCSDDGARSSTPRSGLVGPEAFARRVGDAGVVTINVHVPDEGSIAGTDLTIPFDAIADSTALPTDRDTPLAIYCRSGNMSADAVDDLEAMGYTDVVELDGGFRAWEESGRRLEPAAG